MEWYEVAFDRLYPVLYSHRDSDEASRAIDAYGAMFTGRSPVLDLASGDGRYLEAVLRLDIDVYGLDLSHYLLCKSIKGWGHGGRVVQGDMRRLPFAGGTFGGVLNMFTSFGYFSADTDNLLVLREVHRVLGEDGVFLFDYINARRIATRLLRDTTRESLGYTVHEKRMIEGSGKYLVKRAIVTDPRTQTVERVEERLRLYPREDLELMMESVGFEIQRVYGDYAGNPFVEGVSDRVVIVSRRP